jgi:hypothetical protein
MFQGNHHVPLKGTDEVSGAGKGIEVHTCHVIASMPFSKRLHLALLLRPLEVQYTYLLYQIIFCAALCAESLKCNALTVHFFALRNTFQLWSLSL